VERVKHFLDYIFVMFWTESVTKVGPNMPARTRNPEVLEGSFQDRKYSLTKFSIDDSLGYDQAGFDAARFRAIVSTAVRSHSARSYFISSARVYIIPGSGQPSDPSFQLFAAASGRARQLLRAGL
jgi:hypothetical protein